MVRKLIRHFDYSIIIVSLLLTGFGLIMVYSSSTIVATTSGHVADYFFLKQLFWAFVAVGALIIGSIIPYKLYKAFVKPIIIITLILLVLVLFIGADINNAQSWFKIGPIQIQPAEFAKLSIIIYLASVFSNKQAYISEFKSSVLPPLVMTSLVFLLIALQPDLGSAMIIAGIAVMMILCSGIRMKHIIMLMAFAVIALSVIFSFSLSSEQESRFTSAYHPFDKNVRENGGWQLINSYIAIASGGLTGKGLGDSVEKSGFLPEPHTDFIMAIVAEELGVFGVLFVIICIAYIVIRSILIGIRCQDVFGSLTVIGIGSFIGIQTFINLGVVSGLLPITGVTLPFISYGGSSLVVLLFAIGIVVNISATVRMKEQGSQEEAESWEIK